MKQKRNRAAVLTKSEDDWLLPIGPPMLPPAVNETVSFLRC